MVVHGPNVRECKLGLLVSNSTKQELISYRQQIAQQLHTQYVEGMNYGLFAPKTIRSRERKFPGTFAPWNFRSLVLSKRMEDGAKVRNRERKLTIFSYDTGSLRTDRKTDGQICYINIARQYADAR